MHFHQLQGPGSFLSSLYNSSYGCNQLRSQALFVSFGSVLISFMISLSLSPTTKTSQQTQAHQYANLSPGKLTCPAVIPVDNHRPLERALARVELP